MAYQPKWEPLFWDLAAFDVGALLKLPRGQHLVTVYR